MAVDALYYEDQYAIDATAEVTDIDVRNGGLAVIQLDRTVFYPEGGGQPADQGEIVTETGTLKVNTVRAQNGAILHEGKLAGQIEAGQSANVSVKWPRRQKYMRVHSAGHLLNDVLLESHPDLRPVRGKHGDKAFLEYDGELDPDVKDELENSVNAAVAADLPIKTWECPYEELVKICKTLPANLPTHKELRVLQIGDYEPMPDGGVHVKSTGEIGKVVIHHITNENGHVVLRYGVGAVD